MNSDVLNGLVAGIIAVIFYGGLSVAILGSIGWYRRRQGKPAPMRSVLVPIAIGAVGCVVLHAAGFQTFGLGVLAVAVMAGYWAWE